MKWLVFIARKIYSVWCIISFIVPFLVLLPLFRIFILRKEWFKYAHNLNRFWSGLQLFLYGLPIKVVHKAPLDKNQLYIYAPNHTSYIDIPLLLKTVPGFLNFVGKISLTRIPLWGIIYKRLYISVDRESQISRAKTYIYSKKSLEQNRSIVIFPEGKIPEERVGLEMAPFKDGLFKLAIERKVPIVPVSMPYNHIFLPDVKGRFIVRWHPLKIVFHEPIDTTNLTDDDLEPLKARVYNLIKSEFITQKHEHRY